MTASVEDTLIAIEAEIKNLPNLIAGSTVGELTPYLDAIQSQVTELKDKAEAIPAPESASSEWLSEHLAQQIDMLWQILGGIAALPNQIAGPTLEELYRTLLPVRDNIYENGQTMSAIAGTLTSLRTDIEALQAPAPAPDTTRLDEQFAMVAASLDRVQTGLDAQRFDHSHAFNSLEIAALAKSVAQTRRKRPDPVGEYDPDLAFQNMQEHKPDLYDTWKSLFDTGGADYIQAPNQNCSTWSSSVARAFRSYVRLHCQGQVLDIGCGPHADPVYLQGLDDSRLSAVEPLELVREPAFPVYRAVNEFLPFADKSFQTIINATSLDHCIDIERALDETVRVLDTGGILIIWYANVKTAANPVTEFAGPIDAHHLFHTNDAWFLPMLEERFVTVNRHIFAASDTSDDIFAVYRKK